MFLVIENGRVYDPSPIGQASILLVNDRIAHIGSVDVCVLEKLHVPYEVIDASGKVVIPGLIDPHEHLRGGSGEGGFRSESPPIYLSEIIRAGITTVVGTLGVDTTMTTLEGLLAQVKGLNEQGMTAYMYTGGYAVPPKSITSSVRNDILLIAEVLGAGEIAIADRRSTDHEPLELSKLVHDAYVGGLLSGKAGVTHFHVGDGKQRLSQVRRLLDDFDVDPSWVYPTHVERTRPLMREALALVRQGVTVDIDVVNKDMATWLKYYLDHDGNPGQLTVSSDAFLTSPYNLFAQVIGCIKEHGFALETVLPLVTANTARVLHLPKKGRLTPGADADVVVLDEKSLEILEVIARGRRFVKDGQLVVREAFLGESDRIIEMRGKKPF